MASPDAAIPCPYPIVLLHSPHLSPLTWSLMADELRRWGNRVVVPSFAGLNGARPPFASYLIRKVEEAIEDVAPGEPVLLVAHGWAGPALPVVARGLRRDIAGYVLTDSPLPEDGASVLDLVGDSRSAEMLRTAVTKPMTLIWTGEELQDFIPQPAIRRRFVASVPVLPLGFYEEGFPVFPGWPDAPCGYLRLSGAHDNEAEQARRAALTVWELDGGPFEMLAAPSTVGRALLGLIARMLRLEEEPTTGARTDHEPPSVAPEPGALEEVERQMRASFAELRSRLSDAVLGSVIAEIMARLDGIEERLDVIHRALPGPARSTDAPYPAGPSPEREPGPRVTVLLVDDDAQNRATLRELLSLEGLVVTGEAGDGVEAVDLVSAVRPDVVLMDLEMPKMGGIEATRRIKDASPGTQVIILTVHDEPLPARSAAEVGAYAYLIKGAPPRLIRDVVLKASEHGKSEPSSGHTRPYLL